MYNRQYFVLFGKKLTKEDFLEATSAFLDVILSKEDATLEVVEGSTIKNAVVKSNEEIVEEVFARLGLSFSKEGTRYIRDIVLYYLVHKDKILNIKVDVHPILFEKYNVGYEKLRACMREAIKFAMVKPTPLTKNLFEDNIKKNKTVPAKEFIVKVLDFCKYYAISLEK